MKKNIGLWGQSWGESKSKSVIVSVYVQNSVAANKNFCFYKETMKQVLATSKFKIEGIA